MGDTKQPEKLSKPEKQIIHIVFPDKLHIQFDNYDHRSPLADKISEVLALQLVMTELLKKVMDLLAKKDSADIDRIGKKLDAITKDLQKTIS